MGEGCINEGMVVSDVVTYVPAASMCQAEMFSFRYGLGIDKAGNTARLLCSSSALSLLQQICYLESSFIRT